MTSLAVRLMEIDDTQLEEFIALWVERRSHELGRHTGFNARTGPEAKRRLNAIQMDTPPIPGLKAKGAVWTRPEIVVEIEYRGWTEDHQLRHTSFKGIREDRSADEFL